jgi:parallel beta-helix repeat protein
MTRILSLIVIVFSLSYATTFKINQQNSSTLQQILSQAKPGDQILLEKADYGKMTISGKNDLLIAAQKLHEPTFESITIANSTKITIRGLSVRPKDEDRAQKATLVVIQKNLNNCDILIDSCFIYSSIKVFPTAAAWLARACNAMSIRAQKTTVSNCHILNVYNGIDADALETTVSNNIIENFAGDGLRCNNGNTILKYNIVKNNYHVNDDHNDGIQSFTIGSDGKVGTGTIKNVKIIGNQFYSFTDNNQPFKCGLQGIGCFDGMYENWEIINNVVCVDHWHGISLYGATNCKIINNTVIPIEGRNNDMLPSIRIFNHKTGKKSSGNIIRNNLCYRTGSDAADTKMENNIQINNFNNINEVNKYFFDYVNNNLKLAKNSPAIGKGLYDNSIPFSSFDIEGKARTPGNYDVGAYQFIGNQFPTRINPDKDYLAPKQQIRSNLGYINLNTHEMNNMLSTSFNKFNLNGSQISTNHEKMNASGYFIILQKITGQDHVDIKK